MTDVLGRLAHLSATFQKTNVDLEEVQTGIGEVRHQLERFQRFPGRREEQFMNEWNNGNYNMQNEYKKDDDSDEKFGQHRTIILDKVLKQLQERFPDMAELSRFNIFAPDRLPTDELGLWRYGESEIEELHNHYSNRAELNLDALQEEWDSYKVRMKYSWAGKKQNEIRKDSLEYTSKYMPNLHKILCIEATLALHTADCERGFSKMNSIKTKKRNRSSVDLVEMLMQVSTLPFESNYSKAVDTWFNTQKRYHKA